MRAFETPRLSLRRVDSDVLLNSNDTPSLPLPGGGSNNDTPSLPLPGGDS